MALRDYQLRAIRATYDSLRQHDRTMLQLPTGAGKTHVAMEIIKHGLKFGRRVNFCVDRLTLLDQTVDRFMEEGLPVSVVQGSHSLHDPRKPVQIISLQTLQRRQRSQWPPADLFIIDEAHTHYGITTRLMTTWDRVKYLGLSATPWTRGLGLVWHDLVVGATVEELMLQGYLSKYTAYGPSQPNLRGVRISNGDWNSRELEERMNTITGDIITHFRIHGEGKKALAFTPTVAYAEHLVDVFRAEGFTADFVCGHDSEERRLSVLNAYRAGEIQVLCNCEVLIKGYDQPDIEVGIVARPTRSRSLHIQMLGRLLRISKGKDRAIILDHAGNIGRLGFPDDEQPTTLCDREKGSSRQDQADPEEPTPWTCPECFTIVPPRTRQCPACGFIPRRRPELEVVEGSLRKLAKHGMVEKQDVYSQLLHVAHDKGYQHGWVAHQYRSIFGVWPRCMIEKPVAPEPSLLSWLKSQQIRHAKRRERNE